MNLESNNIHTINSKIVFSIITNMYRQSLTLMHRIYIKRHTLRLFSIYLDISVSCENDKKEVQQKKEHKKQVLLIKLSVILIPVCKLLFTHFRRSQNHDIEITSLLVKYHRY